MVRDRRKPSDRHTRGGYPNKPRRPTPFPCKHWWLFETPESETVTGTCRKCGDVQVVLTAWQGWTDQRTDERVGMDVIHLQENRFDGSP